MTITPETETSTPVTVSRLTLYGVVAAIIASAMNALVRVSATTLFEVPSDFGPLGWGPIINTTLVGVIGATAVFGLHTRISKQPNRTFFRVALAVLILSFVPLLMPPTFLATAPVSVLGTLAVMHVLTAIIVVGLLLRTTNTGVPLQ